MCSGHTASRVTFVRILRGPGWAGPKNHPEISLLVQFHLWKQIPEEFSMRSERPQSSTLRETPPQCVPATTAPFSPRSCYRLLQNSPTFKHGEETKLAQCLHHPRNTTPYPQVLFIEVLKRNYSDEVTMSGKVEASGI